MPRDLQSLAKEQAMSDMSPLDRAQQDDSNTNEVQTHQDELQQQEDKKEAQPEGTMFANLANSTSRDDSNPQRDDLHPYTQTLTLSDVDSCTVLEEAAFPPNERATREKVSLSCRPHFIYSCRTHTCHSCDMPSVCVTQHPFTSSCMRWPLVLP